MAPSRARSTRPSASARPSASQRLALRPEADGILARQIRNKLPAHQPAKHPLSAITQRKLATVAQAYRRRDLAAKNLSAIKQLAECAHDLGEDLKTFSEQVERQRKKGMDVERWEGKMEVYRPKQENLKARLEKNARVCVDLGRRGEVLVRAVEACGEPVPGTQERRRTQGQGQGSSFEPTLPGATEREDTPLDDANGNEGSAANILGNFKARRQQDLDTWMARSLYDRYAQDKGYADFRQQEFEGYNDDEEQDPPSPEKWFETEEPAPGTATQGAADESDDDIQIARAKISTKCPLTLQEFKDPVMSTVCKHTFEKSAIDEMIGRRPQVQCPVGGCPNYITRAQLEPNDKLLRKIRRIQQSRNRHRVQLDDDDDDDHAPHGTNANTSILLSDDGPGDAGGFHSLDAHVSMKQERVSQRRSGGGDDDEEVTDEDTEDE